MITKHTKLALLIASTTLFCACGGDNVSNSSQSTSSTLSSSENSDNVPSSSSSPYQAQDYQTKDAYLMAMSIVERNPSGYGGWNYETATVLRGFEEIYRSTGDGEIFDYLQKTVDNVITESGGIRTYSESEYNLDQIKEGSLLLFLYEETGEEKYRIAADALRKQLERQPKTESGGYWHKNKYPNQMWLDGLYMAEPFLAHYTQLFEGGTHIDDVIHQLTLVKEKTTDPMTGLLFHAWDESGDAFWTDSTTHQSPIFWGRAMGWYMMALVDVLDNISVEDTTSRETLTNILTDLTRALTAYQDNDGVWWQVTDKPNQAGNWQESSATAMYVYAIAKGVRMGYLETNFRDVAERGWAGLNNLFIERSGDSLTLTDTCEGTGVSNTYNFYIGRRALDNDPKGLGPYMLAAVEMNYLQDL